VSRLNIFFGHFLELRSTLIKSLFIYLIVFLAMMPFANEIYYFFSQPLLDQLTSLNGSIISTKLTSTFIVPFKITAYCALIISLPFIFLQIWNFISPGLYKNEKKFVFWSMFFGFILFVAGTLFVYFLIFPVIFNFFVSSTPNDVELMIDISSYLQMIIALFLAFGLAFEVPLLIITAVKFNWIKIKTLENNRPYIVVAAFVFGAIFTPPDIISQVLLALPILFLYEIGLFISKNKLFKRH
jgi:sec-independent protein translocase protein TatC